MTSIWRYLTQSAGMTAQMLAESTGMTIQAVRADLAELELKGKAARERAAIGKPHLWWRAEKRPVDGLHVLLVMALAAELQPSAAILKEVLADVGSRAKSPAISKIVAMCAMSKAPREIIWASLENLDHEDEALRAA